MPKHYRHIWSEKRSLVNVEAHIRQYQEQRDVLGSTHTYSFVYAERGIAEEFHRDVDNQKWYKQSQKLLDKKFVKQLHEQGLRLRNDFQKFILDLEKKQLSDISNANLVEEFVRSYRFHSRFRAIFKTSRGEFLHKAEKKLKSLLNKRVADPEEANEIFVTLTTPSALDRVNEELIEWTGLLLEKKGNQRQAIKEHLYEYPWLAAHTYDVNQILKHFQNKLESDKKRIIDFKAQVSKLKKEKEILASRQKKLLKSFNSNKVGYLSWLFQEMSLERMRLKGGWAGSDFLYYPLYLEITKRTGIPLRDLYSFYRIDEVISIINKKGKKVSREELERRRRSYVLWMKRKSISFYSGQQAKKIINKELRELKIRNRQSRLKGQPASKGKVKGKVKVIIPGDITMLKKSMRDFKKGDILVSTMTQPNMVPIMKKAAAVVTDEGGLTSHAAIVARELNIPCIVGTEIATKTLKDGQKVEVDSEKGFVRII